MCDLFEKFGERFEFDAPPHRSQPFRLRPDVHVGIPSHSCGSAPAGGAAPTRDGW
jgi:hypothetical protein